ncbi:MAG: hypothetical protein D8M59_16940 [Planctomycetes bacterium]|nr:hypothetical protein [Planctomycetota bacterium]
MGKKKAARQGRAPKKDQSAVTTTKKTKKQIRSATPMEQATAALQRGQYFEAERLANECLHTAWEEGDFAGLSRIALPLQEARRQRRLMAAEAGMIQVIDGAVEPVLEALVPGCYIITPPNVGADARSLSNYAFDSGIPIIAIAREPVTQMGLLPVVSVGPTIIRTLVKQPKDDEHTVAWCLAAIDSLTDAALDSIDEHRSAPRRVNNLMDLLDSLPESEELHRALAETAAEAAREKTIDSEDADATA